MKGLTPIRFGPEVCQDIVRSSALEWVVTNGLGGFASSTILGMNTRRSHGLLVVAAPPAGRIATLSKVEETVVLPGARFELASNHYTGVIHPEGYQYLVEFRLDPCPTFFYLVGKTLLEKTIFLLPGENAVVVGYTLHAASGPIQLALRPLVAMRDFRFLVQENEDLNPQVEQAAGLLTLRPYPDLPALSIHHAAEMVDDSPCWNHNFEYTQESREGPPPPFGSFQMSTSKAREDLWSPGQLLYLLKPGESCALVASLGRRGAGDLIFHRRRLENTQTVLAQTMVSPGVGPMSTRLSWGAENFIAARPTASTSRQADAFLISDFPWGGLNGRQALIALPGLLLATRRFELARSVLTTLAAQMKKGLIPVRWTEEEGLPQYDSADTSLWFFWAVWHYWQASQDRRFITKTLWGALEGIMEGYLGGTEFGIGMDEDGLIHLADEELALTWMDAREPSGRGEIPGPPVTPRSGKPVEVNALWYCALMVMAAFGETFDLKRAGTYKRLARLVQRRFARTFCSPEGFLYDRVTPSGPDSTLRPNMLIAASLPFCPLAKAQASQVLSVVRAKLLTPWGIRTLSPEDPQYRGKLTLKPKAWAQGLHQGTIWTWLWGPYVSAVLKTRGAAKATQAVLTKQLAPFKEHLDDKCLGAVSELFEAEPPHAPRGGVAQAAAAGELIRAIQEAHLTWL